MALLKPNKRPYRVWRRHGIYKLASPAEKTSMGYFFTYFYVFSKGEQVKIKLTNLKFSTNASLDMFFTDWESLVIGRRDYPMRLSLFISLSCYTQILYACINLCRPYIR